jgi:hypothetical protein
VEIGDQLCGYLPDKTVDGGIYDIPCKAMKPASKIKIM